MVSYILEYHIMYSLTMTIRLRSVETSFIGEKMIQ